MFFSNAHHMNPREYFWEYWEEVLPLDDSEAFLHDSISDKTLSCLEEKPGTCTSEND